MATQNPIEHEGTYNLPEAQLDRFLMYIKISQPDAAAEHKILSLVRGEAKNHVAQIPAKISVEDVLAARKEVLDVHMSEAVEDYLVHLVVATRHPETYDAKLTKQVLYGASPRATIALDKATRINAWIEGRDFVSPEDVQAVVYDILRHRIILSFEAQAEGVSTDDIIQSLLKAVPLP